MSAGVPGWLEIHEVIVDDVIPLLARTAAGASPDAAMAAAMMAMRSLRIEGPSGSVCPPGTSHPTSAARRPCRRVARRLLVISVGTGISFSPE